MNSAMSGEPKPILGSRVNQLDAAELDGELLGLFKSRLTDAFKYVNGNFVASYEPEVKALLKALLFGFPLWSASSTVGQRLLGLEYFAGEESSKRISKTQIGVFLTLTVAVPWIKERLLQLWLRHLPHGPKRNKIEQAITCMDAAVQCANVINFILFLRNGVFHSLATRLMRVYNGHANPQLFREVQYDSMNRELLWHGFAEFLAFSIPIINFYSIKNTLKLTFLRYSKKPTEPSERTRADFASCAICSCSPTQPHEMGCRHVFCYFCIASNVTACSNFMCPSCNHTCDGMDRVVPATLPSM
ncbi:peroxisome biogenesis factor 2-like [Ornithodoros turicata]|uniref:peroxisome biogenesis factor 2-like n=1 Tax=Ornithodoros turicata TaxID=34597 RepID=UPI003139490E